MSMIRTAKKHEHLIIAKNYQSFTTLNEQLNDSTCRQQNTLEISFFINSRNSRFQEVFTLLLYSTSFIGVEVNYLIKSY